MSKKDSKLNYHIRINPSEVNNIRTKLGLNLLSYEKIQEIAAKVKEAVFEEEYFFEKPLERIV